MLPLLAIAAIPVLGQIVGSLFAPKPDMSEINKATEQTMKNMEETNKALVDFGYSMKGGVVEGLAGGSPMPELSRQTFQNNYTPMATLSRV